MGTVEDRTRELWSTTEATLRYVDIPLKGGNPDVEASIDTATDSVQSWVIEETSIDPERDEWPTNLTSLGKSGKHSLLGTAVSALAASEEHEKRATNIQSDRGQGNTPRHVFLEERAETKFKEWLVKYRASKDEDGNSRARDLSRSVSARSSSLMRSPTQSEKQRYRRL